MLVWTLTFCPYRGVDVWTLGELVHDQEIHVLGTAPTGLSVEEGCATSPFLGFLDEASCRKAMGLPPKPSTPPSTPSLPQAYPEGYYSLERLEQTPWHRLSWDASRLCEDTQGVAAYGFGVDEQGRPSPYWKAATFPSLASCIEQRGIPQGSSFPLYFPTAFETFEAPPSSSPSSPASGENGGGLWVWGALFALTALALR